MLLLVKVEDDAKLFGGDVAKINDFQQLEQASIPGKLYYRLKCTVIELNKNDVIHGVANKTYSAKNFRDDFKSRNGGFIIKFDEAGIYRHFNWRDIIDHLSYSGGSSVGFFCGSMIDNASFTNSNQLVKMKYAPVIPSTRALGLRS